MTEQWNVNQQRVLELLADRAAFGLESVAEQELRQLLHTMPDFDTECMERAASTVQLALISVEPMPEGLRAKIQGSGVRHVETLSEE